MARQDYSRRKMEQLDLFDEILPQRFAVIYCTNIMEDQNGDTWERIQIHKSNLPEDVANKTCSILNSQLKPGTSNYYKVIEQLNINYLIS